MRRNACEVDAAILQKRLKGRGAEAVHAELGDGRVHGGRIACGRIAGGWDGALSKKNNPPHPPSLPTMATSLGVSSRARFYAGAASQYVAESDEKGFGSAYTHSAPFAVKGVEYSAPAL